MRIGQSWFVVGMFVAAVACKGKGDPAPAAGSAAGSATGSGAGSGSGSGSPASASGSGSGSGSGAAASASGSGSASAAGSGSAAAAGEAEKLTPAEQVAADWLLAVFGGNDKRAAELTALPFTAGGFQLSGCKPATNAAELTAFVKCASANDLIAKDLTAQALSEQHGVSEGTNPREYAAFLKENAKDVKRLPAGHTRVHVGVNGDGQYLEFLLTVKDGKVTGGVFGGEAVE